MIAMVRNFIPLVRKSLLIVGLMSIVGCATKMDTTELPENMEFGAANKEGYKRIQTITYSQPLPQMEESEYLDRMIECVDQSIVYERAWARRANTQVRKDAESTYSGNKQDLVESSAVISGVYTENNSIKAIGVTSYPVLIGMGTAILRFRVVARIGESNNYVLQFDSIQLALSEFLDKRGFTRATNNSAQKPEKIYEKTRLMSEAFDRCMNATGGLGTASVPINLIPMYGYPEVQKTQAQNKVDEEFIREVSKSVGSRENAAKEFAARGWHHLQQYEDDTAMRRFNQSWLLNADNFMPYWGFGVLLKRQGKAAEAIPHFDRALSIMGDQHRDRPRLLADAAMAYADLAHDLAATDKAKSEESFTKASSLAEETLRLDSRFGDEALKREWEFREAYSYGAYVRFDQGNYVAAWEVVKKSRDSGGYVYKPGFVEELSMKMPEPK
jgi:tetratricopeptide (TPR) repeat protein